MSDDASTRTGHVVKLLVTGPFAAGKTTLIGAVSETLVVDTEVAATGDERAIKARTTVAMDFGTRRIVDADGRVDLLVFGTPGQRRFWFMTDVMKRGVDAVVFVIDATRDDTHPEASAAMRALLRDLHVPVVVAVNRCDDARRAGIVARHLGALHSDAVVPCQLVHETSSREVVVEALIAALARLEAPGTPPWRSPLERVVADLSAAGELAA